MTLHSYEGLQRRRRLDVFEVHAPIKIVPRTATDDRLGEGTRLLMWPPLVHATLYFFCKHVYKRSEYMRRAIGDV